jgi:hypothetical protein
MKDVYATQALKTSPTLQNTKYCFFLFENIVFALLDQDLADPNQGGSMRLRIHTTGYRYARQLYGRKSMEEQCTVPYCTTGYSTVN